jgi:uncharacterized protein YqgV (UPF0045/DUF77 family)
MSGQILNAVYFLGQATIRAIKNPERTLGQRLRLSVTDVIKIDALYDCTGKINEKLNEFTKRFAR